MLNPNLRFLIERFKKGYRYCILRGGTGSGKTWSVLQFLVSLCFSGKYEINIVGCSYPHLKNGAYRDLKKILEAWKVPYLESKSTFSLKIKESIIKFISADKPERFRGLRRDILYVNEANLIDAEKFKELAVRTHRFIIADFNPSSRFYIIDYFNEMGLNYADYEIVTTYKDNPHLPEEVKKEIESRINTPWYRVFGAGEWGADGESVLYNYTIDDVDETLVSWLGVGLDIGYNVSPTAAVLIGKYKEKVFVKELFYEVCNIEDFVNFAKDYKQYRFIVDAAATDEIYILRKAGIKAFESTKKRLVLSYDILNSVPLIIDRKSKNLINEVTSLRWADKTKGKTEGSDHLIDAIRYAFHYFVK